MTTWTLRLGLSLMITIGCWPGRLPAQTLPPTYVPPTAPSGEKLPPPSYVPPTAPSGPNAPNIPYGPPAYLPYAPQVMVVPAVPYEPAHPLQYPPAYALPKYPPPADYHARRALNNHGLGCLANPDGACGSFYSEMRFIFGSCRSFFGDPCYPNQPCADRRNGRLNGPNGCGVPGDFPR